jgi:arylamine N-acetyltransferase
MAQSLLMSIQTADGGRVTLLNNELRIVRPDGGVDVQEVENADHFRSILEQHFGIGPVDQH